MEPCIICDRDEVLKSIQEACLHASAGGTASNLLCTSRQEGVHGRKLALLNNGLIAAVPENVAVNDSVCVLNGCSVPVCLRDIHDSLNWALIGECYVHGYMNGEAISQRNSGTLEELSYPFFSVIKRAPY